MKINGKKRKNKVKNSTDIVMIISLAIIFIYCLSMIYVLFWGFINSIKVQADMVGKGGLIAPNLFGFPRSGGVGEITFGWRFDNYIKAFEMVKLNVVVNGKPGTVNLIRMMLNSLIYSISMSFFGLVTPLLVAYACGKYEFRFKKLLYATAIIVMLIPIVGSLSSELSMQKTFHLENLIGVCIMKNNYAGLYFLVFYAVFKNTSWTYAEAAQIDGAGHGTIFFRIMIPLVKTSIMAVFILLFIQNWNEYYIPMMFLPTMPTVAFGLHRLTANPVGGVGATEPMLLASAFLVAIPIIVVYVALRNKIIGNVTMGGLKG